MDGALTMGQVISKKALRWVEIAVGLTVLLSFLIWLTNPHITKFVNGIVKEEMKPVKCRIEKVENRTGEIKYLLLEMLPAEKVEKANKKWNIYKEQE